MSEKPEALRLADRLDLWGDQGDLLEAATELRRQHALIKEWEAKAETWLLSPEAAQRLDGYRELSQRAWRAEIDLTATEAELREVSDRAFKAEAERDALRAECRALRRHIKLLQSKADAEKSCACAYDSPDEVCLPHSPLVEELHAECDALREDAERWQFVRRHSWKELQRARVLAGIKAESVLGQNWEDAIDDLLEAAGTTEQAIAARAALKEPK